jgi:UDP-MurNAc hydroxylase
VRFTLIGHAAVFVETSGPSLLLDPWLWGSCFWRSWWHYPPRAELEPHWLSPDFIYLTHYHFDHFHYPSMRKLDKQIKVLLPRFGVDTMRKEVEELGFEHVEEMPHGWHKELAPGVSITAYQYGFDDSCVVIADGDDIIVNCNDCKIKGRSLEQVKQDFGRPTFMWKNHSYSVHYPLCYEAEDATDLELVTRDSFSDDFNEVAASLRPRYAVPFASTIAFLHPESRFLNASAITPNEIAEKFEAAGDADDSQVVVMQPGDGWDSDTGFVISETDWHSDREEKLDQLAEVVRPRLEHDPVETPSRKLLYADFEQYMNAFFRALPPLVPRLLLNRPIVFDVPSSPERYWVIDFLRSRVRAQSELPEDWASVIRVNEALAADTMAKGFFCGIGGSMRLRVSVARGGISQDLAFWGLLLFWESGYLPLWRRLTSPRFLRTLWDRRREAIDQLEAILRGRGPLLKRLSRGFTPTTKHESP